MPSLSIPRPIDRSVTRARRSRRSSARSHPAHHGPADRGAPTRPAPPSPPTPGTAGSATARSSPTPYRRPATEASATAFFDWCSRRDRRRAGPDQVDRRRDARRPARRRPIEMLPARFTVRRRRTAPTSGGTSSSTATAPGCGRSPRTSSARPATASVSEPGDRTSPSTTCSRPGNGRATTGGRSTASTCTCSTLACIAAGLRPSRSGGLVETERVEAHRDDASARSVELITERGVRRRSPDQMARRRRGRRQSRRRRSRRSVWSTHPARLGASERSTRSKRHLTVDGGVHRYLGDTFFGGGQWPLLSCFLGLAQRRRGTTGARRASCWSGRRRRRRPTASCPSRSTTTSSLRACSRSGSSAGAPSRRRCSGATRCSSGSPSQLAPPTTPSDFARPEGPPDDPPPPVRLRPPVLGRHRAALPGRSGRRRPRHARRTHERTGRGGDLRADVAGRRRHVELG